MASRSAVSDEQRSKGLLPEVPQAILKACDQLKVANGAISLTELAQSVGLSPSHFHRRFKACMGVTPKAYALLLRSQRIREELDSGSSVTEAIYSAGFNSSSRFYANLPSTLGMTPSAYRRFGKGVAIKFAVGLCSLGSVLVAASERGVCAILLGDEPEALVRDLQDRFAQATLVGACPEFEIWVAQVVGFIDSPAQKFELPLDLRGTTFQLRVWQALLSIPPGLTLSYSELAARIGDPRSARAVARACAANPLAVAIPCHRVVRTDGSLSGYRWGIERKRELLSREAAESGSMESVR